MIKTKLTRFGDPKNDASNDVQCHRQGRRWHCQKDPLPMIFLCISFLPKMSLLKSRPCPSLSHTCFCDSTEIFFTNLHYYFKKQYCWLIVNDLKNNNTFIHVQNCTIRRKISARKTFCENRETTKATEAPSWKMFLAERANDFFVCSKRYRQQFFYHIRVFANITLLKSFWPSNLYNNCYLSYVTCRNLARANRMFVANIRNRDLVVVQRNDRDEIVYLFIYRIMMRLTIWLQFFLTIWCIAAATIPPMFRAARFLFWHELTSAHACESRKNCFARIVFAQIVFTF